MYGTNAQITRMLSREEIKIAKMDHRFPSGNALSACTNWIRHFVPKDGNNLSYYSQTAESKESAAETRKSQKKRAVLAEKGNESQFGPPDKAQHFDDTRKRYVAM